MRLPQLTPSFAHIRTCASALVLGLGLAWLNPLYGQYAADTLTVSIPEIRNNGDLTVNESLLRDAGIYTNADGVIFLRGMPSSTAHVIVNGLRLGATYPGERGTDLGALSVSPFRSVHYIRILTPDMDADALTGVVSLRTSDFDLEASRSLNILAGGGANPYFFSLTGPAARGSLTYTDRISESLSIRANIAYHQEARGSEGIRTTFAARDFGAGLQDVLQRVSPFVQTTSREHTAGVLDIVYQPDDARRMFFSAYLSNDMRESNHYFDAWNANNSWADPTQTTGGQSTYQQVAELQETSRYHHALQAGGQQHSNGFTIDYALGWTRSLTDNRSYQFPFMITGRNLNIDMSNRDRPVMEVNNFNLQADGSIDRQFMTGQPFNRLIEDHIDNQFTARADVSRSLSGLTLQSGISARFATQTGTYSDASLQFVRVLRLNRFNFMEDRNFSILGNDYDLPWLLNTEDAKRFTESQRPQFVRNENTFRSRSEIRNYDLTQRIIAGYVMGTATLLPGLDVRAGVRVESAGIDAIGRKATFSQTGAFIASVDSNATVSGIDVLPHITLRLKPTRSQQISASYYRSLQRADHNTWVPFEFNSIQQQLIFRGNPELSPVTADHVDVAYGMQYSTGRFHLAVFAKRLQELTGLRESTVLGGDNDGWTLRQYVNTEEVATIFGLEAAVEQRFSFLGGFLSNFGVMGNYTYTDVAYSREGRDGDVRLPGHTPHVLNAGLDYAQGRFYLQVLYHWSAENLLQLAETTTVAPSISATTPVFMDTYQNGWSDLSVSGTFRISPQFNFWVDVNNLLATEYVNYQYSRSAYPVQTSLRAGRNFQLGIRYDL
jgi:TonB-dependent receptor